MDISSVCILGGSGFVGRSIAEQACARGLTVRVLTRSAPRARALLVLPTVEIIAADPRDEEALARAFAGIDVVVNLVGILHETRANSFEKVHVELPRKVVNACRAASVRQLLHMSALGASASGPSAYQRSKGEGEAVVRQTAHRLPVTIFRPSVIFGIDDRFLNLFAQLVRWFPVIPLAGAHTRFQPIWVEDVARAFVAAMGDTRTFGESFELCGPHAYKLEELVRFVAAVLGKRRAIVALPRAAAELQALLLEHLPGKLMTRDNLRSMRIDNVCSMPFPALFGFQPASLEAIVPEYLSEESSRGRYTRYRYRAGR